MTNGPLKLKDSSKILNNILTPTSSSDTASSYLSEENVDPTAHRKKNCCFGFSYAVIAHPLFTLVIIIAIVMNIIVLALDRVNMSD